MASRTRAEGECFVAEGRGRDSKSGKGGGDDDASLLIDECGRSGRDDRMPKAAVVGEDDDVSGLIRPSIGGGVLDEEIC